MGGLDVGIGLGKTKLKVTLVVSVVLGLLTAVGIANYFQRVHLDFIVETIIVAVTAYAIITEKRDLIRRTALRLSVPYLVLGIVSLLSALTFGFRYGVDPFASFVAQRDVSLIILAPATYLLYSYGISARGLILMLIGTFAIAFAFNEGIHFFENAQAWIGSSNFYRRDLVTYAPWRGYEFKLDPLVSLLALIIGLRAMVQRQVSSLARAGSILLVIGSLYFLEQHLSRSSVTAFAVSLALTLTFVRPRAKLLNATILIWGMSCLWGLIGLGVSIGLARTLALLSLSHSSSLSIRLYELKAVVGPILKNHPILGTGSASYATLSFQQLFGKYFAPVDYGLVGGMVQYGICGLLVFVGLSAGFLRAFFYGEVFSNRHVRMLWVLGLTVAVMGITVAPFQDWYTSADTGWIGFFWGAAVALRTDPRLSRKTITEDGLVRKTLPFEEGGAEGA